MITKISAKWPHSSGFTLEKLEIASNGSVTTETSLVGTAPGLKLEFKGNDSNKGDLSLKYSNSLVSITSVVDVLNLAKASASVSSGQGPFLAGVATDVNLSKSAIGPIAATLGYKVPNLNIFLKSNKTFSE